MSNQKMNGGKKDAMVSIKDRGKELSSVPARFLKSLLLQWEENVPPECADGREVEYMKEQLGIPDKAEFSVTNLIQLSYSLKHDLEKEGNKMVEQVNLVAETQAKEIGKVTLPTESELDDMVNIRAKERGIDLSNSKVNSSKIPDFDKTVAEVNQEEAAAMHRLAMLIAYEVSGKYKDYAAYIYKKIGVYSDEEIVTHILNKK